MGPPPRGRHVSGLRCLDSTSSISGSRWPRWPVQHPAITTTPWHIFSPFETDRTVCPPPAGDGSDRPPRIPARPGSFVSPECLLACFAERRSRPSVSKHPTQGWATQSRVRPRCREPTCYHAPCRASRAEGETRPRRMRGMPLVEEVWSPVHVFPSVRDRDTGRLWASSAGTCLGPSSHRPTRVPGRPASGIFTLTGSLAGRGGGASERESERATHPHHCGPFAASATSCVVTGAGVPGVSRAENGSWENPSVPGAMSAHLPPPPTHARAALPWR